MPRPEEYTTAARALAQSTSSRDTSTSPVPGRPPLTPRWSRPPTYQTHARHISTGRAKRKGWRYNIQQTYWRGVRLVRRMPLWQQLLGTFIGVAGLVLGILFVVYHQQVLSWVAKTANEWEKLRAGWVICWILTFISGFPPLIGYSSTITLAGIVYGFPNGWFIVASASVLGSWTAFVASRTVLSSYVHKLIGNDKRFRALALTLKNDGLKLLVMVRLCPLPYSLSNGALSTIPTINPWSFAAATAIATPRLMIHVFIGSRLRSIMNDGGHMDRKTKIINYTSIIGGLLLGSITGWLIYRRTILRAQQLEEEERAAGRIAQPATTGSFSDDIDDEHAAATLLGDDEIAALEGGVGPDPYTDDFTDSEQTYGDAFDDEEESIGLNKQFYRTGR